VVSLDLGLAINVKGVVEMIQLSSLAIGVITVIFGIVIMIFPKIINYLIGIYLIIIGILAIIQNMQ
jgi:uncharacterized membrane protein HdeD (DUF308 family)